MDVYGRRADPQPGQRGSAHLPDSQQDKTRQTIRADAEELYGFGHAKMAQRPSPSLTFARATYRSPYTRTVATSLPS